MFPKIYLEPVDDKLAICNVSCEESDKPVRKTSQILHFTFNRERRNPDFRLDLIMKKLWDMQWRKTQSSHLTLVYTVTRILTFCM